MGEETEVKRFPQVGPDDAQWVWVTALCLVIILAMTGCDPVVMKYTPPPQPTIKTTIWKEGKAAGIRLEFHHHYIPTNNDGRPQGYTTIDLNDVESVRLYREQIQATLKELTVIEDHMLVLKENKAKESADVKKDP